jgi:hypothetical protein
VSFRANNDGTKLYIIDDVTNYIYEYDLSTAFDISTASYNNVSYNLTSEDNNARGLFFKPDGTKMYVSGGNNWDAVAQYSLSTPWDLSTVSYDNKRHSVSSQGESIPVGVAFYNNGRKMIVAGYATTRIYQYSLSTPWDVSTASYDNADFYFGGQNTTPQGLTIHPDFTKIFMLGTNFGKIFEYDLSVSYWSQETKLTASDAASSANYGISAAIDEQGTVVMIGSHKINSAKGEVYVYQRTGDSWSTATEQKKLTSLTSDLVSNDQFGVSVALSRGGGTAVVGANEINVGSSTQAGGIYLFTGTRI